MRLARLLTLSLFSFFLPFSLSFSSSTFPNDLSNPSFSVKNSTPRWATARCSLSCDPPGTPPSERGRSRIRLEMVS